MRSYRLRTLLPVCLLIAYPALAFLGPKQGRAEFYPFFNWNLFAHSTNQGADVVILVNSLDGEVLERATPLLDLQDRFSSATDIKLAKLLDNFAAAAWRGDEAMLERLQDLIENRYLPEARTMSYDVAIIRYDPIERYRTGRVNSTKSIASLEKQAK